MSVDFVLVIDSNQALEKSYKDLSKLTRKVIIDKNGHRKTVYVKMGLPIKRNIVNEARIAELKAMLKETTEGEIARGKKGWITSGFAYSQDKKDAIPLTPIYREHFKHRIIETEKVTTPKYDSFDRAKMRNEIEALENGFNSIAEHDEHKREQADPAYKAKKTAFKNSILNEVIGSKWHYPDGDGGLLVDIEKLTRAIKDEAVKQGAELYHTSENGGEESSYYLKMDVTDNDGEVINRKVRISNHELPQIMHRNSDDYQESWDKNLTLANDRRIMRFVEMTTKDEFSAFVKNLFEEGLM